MCKILKLLLCAFSLPDEFYYPKKQVKEWYGSRGGKRNNKQASSCHWNLSNDTIYSPVTRMIKKFENVCIYVYIYTHTHSVKFRKSMLFTLIFLSFFFLLKILYREKNKNKAFLSCPPLLYFSLFLWCDWKFSFSIQGQTCIYGV